MMEADSIPADKRAALDRFNRSMENLVLFPLPRQTVMCARRAMSFVSSAVGREICGPTSWSRPKHAVFRH
jgi:hypothetical protein